MKIIYKLNELEGWRALNCSFFHFKFVKLSLCLVLQESGALTLPSTGEESEDQGHDWLFWPWSVCLSAMAEGVEMGSGHLTGRWDYPDSTREQPGLSSTVWVLSSAEVSVMPAAAARQHPWGHSHRDKASGPQQKPASLGAGGWPVTISTAGGGGPQWESHRHLRAQRLLSPSES